MKKTISVFLSIGVILAIAGCASAAPSEPAAGTPAQNGVLQVIERRNSAQRDDFTPKEISDDALLTLAWSASGKNRNGAGFVVPLAMGREPYISLYIALPNGVRKYDWESNSFEQVSGADVRTQVLPALPMLGDLGSRVYAIWIYVIDLDKVPTGNNNWAWHAIGAMSEHQYLVAETLDVQARYMAAINAEGVINVLGLDAQTKLPAGVLLTSHK